MGINDAPLGQDTKNPDIPENPPAPFPGDGTATWTYWNPDDPTVIGEDWVWDRLRQLRNRLLSESDDKVLPDAVGDVDAWRTYRQELRDLPQNTVDPTQAVWPTPPSSTTPGVNRSTIVDRAAQAMASNRQYLAGNPTNAQAIAQVDALTRQMNGVIRLLLGHLDGTD